MKKFEIALIAIFIVSVIITLALLVICVFEGDSLVSSLKPYIYGTTASMVGSALVFFVRIIRNDALISNGQ